MRSDLAKGVGRSSYTVRLFDLDNFLRSVTNCQTNAFLFFNRLAGCLRMEGGGELHNGTVVPKIGPVLR